MTNRNLGIELFRIFCMLAICMQHAVVFSNTGATGFESRYWNIGVVGFAFITGYYGASFKIKKLFSLWMTALWSIGMVALCACIHRGVNCVSCGAFKYALFSNWYLNGYTVLLLMTPILNAALEKLFAPHETVARRTAIIAFTILLIWSWLQELWGIRDWIPTMPGMGMKSFMALIYIYLIGRWVRFADALNVLSGKVWAIWVGCVALIPIFGSNISPVTLFYAIVVFRLFQRIRVPERLGTCIAWVVPSLFAVYLLHTNEFGFSAIAQYVHVLMGHGLPRYVAYVTCALSVFVVCLLLDVPRRLVFAVVERRKVGS